MTGSLLDSFLHLWLMNCEMVISAQLYKIYHFTYLEPLSLVFCFPLPRDSFFMGVFTNIILSQDFYLFIYFFKYTLSFMIILAVTLYLSYYGNCMQF